MPTSTTTAMSTETSTTTATQTAPAGGARPKPKQNPLPTIYLLIYNVTMTAGWLLILLRLLAAVYTTGDTTAVYGAVIVPLRLFQTGALLEIAHSLSGLIRAPALTTAFQVGSRLLLVWGVVEAVPSARTIVPFVTMVLAWSLTEISRYLYFSVAALVPAVPHALTIVRYSTFIPLYPLGAGSEWFTMYSALDYIRHANIFSIQMPNRFNFAFDYYVFSIVMLALYIPGLPYMFLHMVHQRRKYVNPTTKPANKTA